MEKSLGKRIAQLRKEQGMTQQALAEKMNVTDKAVSKWERDQSCPDIHTMAKLAQVLGVRVEELMDSEKRSAEKRSFRERVNLVFRAVALAMGVAVAVLSVLEAVDMKSAFIMLGIGLAAGAASLLEE